ncbi:MAG: PAS domain S-box protein [Promethearchaeota archaeon]
MSKIKNDLKQTELKYSKLVNSILDVIVEFNLDLNITYINPQIYDITGYSSKELIGLSIQDFVHPEDLSKAKEAIKEAIKSGNNIYKELRIRHKEGYYIPISIKGRALDYKNDIKIVAIFRDITEEKETQELLKKSDKKYWEIIENIEDGYFEVDLNGNYTYINNYICKYLGISKDALIGKSYTSYLEKETISKVFETFNNVYKNNLSKGTFESQVIRNDGTKRIFEGTFYLKYDFNGRKVGFYGFTRDITEKKNAEDKLRQSEEKYREAYNRAELYKDLFYHDINNILSNIKLSIDLSDRYLSEPGKEREIKNLFDIIKKQFVRGTKLVANVHKLSSLDSSEKPLKSVEAVKILKDALKFIRENLQIRDLNIILDSFEKEIYIKANELLIDVFDNLLINAVNYNNNPKVEILIKISKQVKNDKDYIKFEIIDNGIGIEEKKKKIIFQERFRKEKGSKGLGFGLTIVRKIIESYEGEIWVEDRVKGDFSKGSNFIVLIPEAK